ncbi:hypothetical protein [Flavobacterium sp.]|uniref:hypothetical protein n=1 Tax=Flavobacterium sp. TaxID=239 RepID=UPI0040333E7A
MMKTFKPAFRLFAGAVLLLTMSATTLYAQEKDRAGEGAKAVTTEMKTQLSLNDGQYAKVMDINKTFLQKAAEAEKVANATDKAKKLKTLTDDRDAKLKSVLNETQFKTYQAGRAGNAKKLRAYYQ